MIASLRHKSVARMRVYLDEKGNRFPSVSTILGKTKDMTTLNAWKAREIERLGLAEFKAQSARTLERGSRIHKAIETHLLGLSPGGAGSMPSADGLDLHDVEGYWESVKPVLADVSRALVVESAVIHPTLRYAGTIDGIVEYKGEKRIVDWKTSRRRKTTLRDLYDYPLQLAAYVGAVHTDPRYPPEARPTGGIVVVMYEDQEATVVELSKRDLEQSWQKWLARYTEFEATLDSPLRIDELVKGATQETPGSDAAVVEAEKL